MEAQIIRICKPLAIGLSALTLAASPAHSKRSDDGHAQLNRYVEARLAEGADQPQTAVAIYADTLKQQPGNALVASKAYVKAMEVGNFALALKAVRTLELNGTIDAEMPLLLFADAFAEREWRAAETALLELEALKNFAFMAPILDAWLKVANKDLQAVDIQAIRSTPTGQYYYDEQRVLHLLANGTPGAASNLIAKLVSDNDARLSPVRTLIARHFLSQNQTEQALDVLRLKRTGPEARLFDQIQAGIAKGQAQEIDAKTGAAFSLQRLSADLGAQNATFLALVSAQSASRVDPDRDYSHLLLGRAYESAEQGSSARQEFSKVSAQSPYYLIALNAEIGSYIQEKQYDVAEDRINQCIKRGGRIPELQILKAQLLVAQNDYARAVPYFKEAIRLGESRNYPKPLLASYYLALGSAQEQAELWPEGLRSLEKANSLFPNSASILNYLGYAQLERRENTDAAIETIRKAYQLRSDSPAITDSLGWAHFLNGDHQQAVSYLEKALTGQPDDPTINEHLGDAYWTVGREFEARYAWKSAKIFADKKDTERLTAKIDVGLKPETVSP